MNLENTKNIPECMKAEKRWVNYKVDKVPICSKNLQPAKSNDPSTWSPYNVALARAQRDNELGIGFMLGDGYVGVDIDKCRNPETGELTEEAWDIIHILNSYTEISPSGTGIHIICKGSLPEGPRRRGHIEMYDCGRYFTVTGKEVLPA